MFKGNENVRIAIYLLSILINAAAIVVRPTAAEWGDALQYVGGAFAAFSGVVALTNVETESKKRRVRRIVQEELASDTGEIPTQSGENNG